MGEKVINTSMEMALRKQLIKHIKGGEAFIPIDQFIDDIPFQAVGKKPNALPYSLYQQFYHLRTAQQDIIKFSLNPEYKSLNWPDDYWSENSTPDSEKAWEVLKRNYFGERATWCDYLLSTEDSLMDPIPHGNGQTLLRESLLIIEHTAYHSGQMMIIMRELGLWK